MFLVNMLIFLAILCGSALAQTNPGFIPGKPICANYPSAACPAPANPLSLNQAFQNKSDYPYLGPVVGPVGGVTFSGVPSVGWVPIATSPTTAAWGPVSGSPGGSFGQVQFNNTGIFDGLSNASLTALINPATASLPGALPAWPNNTTTFFRGDGTYAAPYAAFSNLVSPFATGFGLAACNSAVITGIDNSCFGANAGKALTGGAGNTFLGFNAGVAATAQANTIAVGSNAFSTSTSGAGTNNVAVGQFAMGFNNVSGTNNVGIGQQALVNVSTHSFNVGIGGFSLASITTGTQPLIGIGWEALWKNTTGIGNIALGHTALSQNVAGNNNNAFGYLALANAVDCTSCLAFGTNALNAYVSGAMFGNNSVAIGTNALLVDSSGYENVGVGTSVLQANTTGFWNTGVGIQAMQAVVGGFSHTCVGVSCFGALTGGSKNTGLGQNAAYSNTSNDCVTCTSSTFIGYGTEPGDSTQRDHQTIIGADAVGVLFSNAITLGRVSGGTVDTTYTGPLTTNGPLTIPTQTPASSSAACGAGQITWDSSFLYVCVATNTWKRVAVTTW